MKLDYSPPAGFIKIDSKLEGVTVFAPNQKKDLTPEAINFKCPQCGAATNFSPSISGIACPNCGYAQTTSTKNTGHFADEFEFTLESLSLAVRGWGALRSELHCDSCGADISLTSSDLSSTCPFCASNRVIARVESQDSIRPRYIIPFSLNTDDCRPKVQRWLGSGWMFPSDLKLIAASTQFRGIYTPFWTFDATINASWRAEVGYERRERYYDRSSKSWKSRTRIDWRWESGQITQNPNDWLGIGTTRISKVLLKRLYPFKMSALSEYEPEFLAGWQALNYDIPLQDAWDTVKAEMRELTRDRCRGQIKSGHVRNFSLLADFDDETWRLILLPIYAAAYRYGEKTYQVLVNGQTGLVTGQKPIAWWKVWLVIIGLLSPGSFLGIIGLIFLFLGGLGIFILGFAAILFLIGTIFSVRIFRQAMQAGEA